MSFIEKNTQNIQESIFHLYKFGIRYFEEFEKLNKRTDTVQNITDHITRSEMELL